MKNLLKKSQIFALLLVMIWSATPVLANASVLDWFSGLKSDYVANGLTVASGAVYADASLSQNPDQDSAPGPLVLQGNSLVSQAGWLGVTKKYPVNSIQIRRIMRVVASAYSSTIDQTDGDPFTTANGTRVRDGIIATNLLPFNTLVKIPDIYGDKIFTVTDRMNARYSNHIDIWFPDRQTAISFGRKTVTMEIVGSL